MTDIPKFHQFMRPLLEVLQERGELARNDAIEAVVQKVGLSEEQIAVSQESNGKSIAADAGALIGLIGPKRGYFALGPNALRSWRSAVRSHAQISLDLRSGKSIKLPNKPRVNRHLTARATSTQRTALRKI